MSPTKSSTRAHEGNAQRKVRFKLVDYNDPNIPVTSDITVIDDEKEEEVISDRANAKNLPLNNQISLSPIKSALANLTTAERENHFKHCMKLSLQNKITTKNAFSLHLIDVFSDNVKQGGDPNFQMASLTLDASTRIYALRVDCLHAETLKMAMGLHSDKIEKKGEDGDEESKDDNCDDDRRAELMKKKKKRKKRFLPPSAAKSLQLVKLETEDEPHEKYHAIKSIFSEGKCAGLLNSCGVISDDFKIPFVEAYPYLSTKKKFSASDNSDRSSINAAMKMLLPLINSTISVAGKKDNSPPVAPSLESFSFLKKKWLHEKSFSGLDETSDTSDEDTSSPNTPQGREIVLCDSKELSDFFANDCNVELDSRVIDYTLFSMSEDSTAIKREYDDANNDFDTSSPVATGLPSLQVPETPSPRGSFPFPNLVEPGSTVKSFQNSYMLPPLPHPQGTFETVIDPLFKVGVDPVVDAALTGRCQGRTKKVVQHISKRNAGPLKRQAHSRFVTFEKDDEIVKKKVTRGKRNKFTENYKSKWLLSETLLPSVSFVSSDFRKTFIIPIVELLDKEQQLNDDDDNETVDNAELNVSSHFDNSHFTPADDDSNNFNQPYKAEELDPATCVTSVDDLQLVPKPEMVKRDMVRYATSSKNVDQKRVKATIWDLITNYYVEAEQDVASEENRSKCLEDQLKHMVVAERCPLKFTTLYGKLLQVLPPGIKDKMSIQIAFVSVLHLTNEKNLNLEQNENENNFSILLK